MQLLLRALITGFGYKIGAELGRLVAEKIGLKKREDQAAEADLPEGLPKTPPKDEDDESPAPSPPDDGDDAKDDDAGNDADAA